MNITRYDELNLSAEIMNALKKKNYESLTSVQAETIPAMLEWNDIIAKAPTGTGKTYAFGIPIIEQMDSSNDQVQALILVPTRELALQICVELGILLSLSKALGWLAFMAVNPFIFN